jgi:hypothetical protein
MLADRGAFLEIVAPASALARRPLMFGVVLRALIADATPSNGGVALGVAHAVAPFDPLQGLHRKGFHIWRERALRAVLRSVLRRPSGCCALRA